jgi:hypothetical protein
VDREHGNVDGAVERARATAAMQSDSVRAAFVVGGVWPDDMV